MVLQMGGGSKTEDVEFEDEDQFLAHAAEGVLEIELDDFPGVQIADNSPMSTLEQQNMLGLLESEQILESEKDESEDDYGIRLSSPPPKIAKINEKI